MNFLFLSANLIFVAACIAVSAGAAWIFILATSGNAGWIELSIYGALIGVTNVVVLPRILRVPVSKPHVDIAYYFVGLLGVVLFFEADRYERRAAELRQAALSQQLIVDAIESEIVRQEESLISQKSATVRRLEVAKSNAALVEGLRQGNNGSTSPLANKIVAWVQAEAKNRALSLEADGDPFQLDLLEKISKISSINELIQFHNQTPRQAFELRQVLETTEDFFPYLLRECVLTMSTSCEDLSEQAELLENQISYISSNIQQLQQGSSFAYSQLQDARFRRREAIDQYATFSGELSQAPSASDSSVVNADRYRRSYWPYAIIAAFTLKLASADSSRIAESLSRQISTAKAYLRLAVNQRKSKGNRSKALNRAIRAFHRRLRRSKSLEQADEFLRVGIELIDEAKAIGEVEIANNVFVGCRDYLREAELATGSVAGFRLRAGLLDTYGDFLYSNDEFEEAGNAYAECLQDRKALERKTLSDDEVFEMAICVLKQCIVSTASKNMKDANQHFEVLELLVQELDHNQQRQISDRKKRARRVLTGFPMEPYKFRKT